MQYTDNYSLKKPQRGVDRANVDDLDDNFDVIDRALADDRQISLLMYDSSATYNTGDIVGYENPTTHRIRAFRCLEDNVTGPWDATKWAQTTLAAEIGQGGSGSSTFAGLSDVSFSNLANGQVPQYNSTSGKWENANPTGGASELSDLDDVSLTTPTEGQILTYDGDDWVNTDAPDVDVTKTASGNPIEISDSANAPLVKCVSAITGSQDLHGYDKPWVGGAGKNKVSSVEAWTVGSDGEIISYAGYKAPIAKIESGKTYVFSINGVATIPQTYAFYSSFPTTGSISYDGTRVIPSGYTFTAPIDGYIVARYADSVDDRIQIEEGSTATSYAPYSNICPITAYTEGEIEVSDGDGNTTTHTTTYPSAIYRGSEDVVNGEVTSEWVKAVFSGSSSEAWDYNSANQAFFCVNGLENPFVDNAKNDFALSNMAEQLRYNAVSGSELVDGKFCIGMSGANNILYFKNTNYSSVADFKTWLSTNNLEIVYRLATPSTTPVTPTNLPIKSLNGYSHIESSTGEMEIEYITGKYQPLVDLIESSSGGGVTQTILYTATAMTDTEINVDLTAYDEYIIYANDTLPSAQIPQGNSFPKSVFQHVLSMSNPNIVLYGYSTAYCSYTVSSNKLTFSESGLNYRIVMIVGLKFGVTPTETRSLSLSKGGEPEVVDKVDEEKKVDEPKEEFAKEPVEQPSEPISEPLETKTDSLSKDEEKAEIEDESKEIEEITDVPEEESEVTEEEPTEEPVDPEPSKEEEPDER